MSPDLDEALTTTVFTIIDPYTNITYPVILCKFCKKKPIDQVIREIGQQIEEANKERLDLDEI